MDRDLRIWALRALGPVAANTPGWRRAPFTVANAALAAVHSAYEVTAGVGLPGQKVFGLFGSVGAHAAVLGGWVGAATDRSRRGQRAAAVLNGVGLAAAATHYLAWPTRWHGPVPVLTDGAEGLRGGWARWYNALLYLWGTTAAVAVGRESHASDGRWALIGVGAAPLVAAASHGKHNWAREQARRRPRWWNRALQP
jgi:hypothetical protein